MRYEIDSETYAIKIYNEGETVPYQFQPDYPNGDKFDSVAEASQWAELSIAAHSDDCPVYAPSGKGLPGASKPTQAEITLAKLGGVSLDELKNLLGLNAG
jgi:hypothetical protein